jgi:anti-sigma factor RsiW
MTMNCAVSYEELAAWRVGDAEPDRAAELSRHAATCPDCSRRTAALDRVDAALRATATPEPSPAGLLDVRRQLSREVRGGAEMMTLDDVAAFLSLTPAEIADVVPELPAFELAGQVRVRRSRLLDWIEGRERDYMRYRILRQIESASKGVA